MFFPRKTKMFGERGKIMEDAYQFGIFLRLLPRQEFKAHVIPTIASVIIKPIVRSNKLVSIMATVGCVVGIKIVVGAVSCGGLLGRGFS